MNVINGRNGTSSEVGAISLVAPGGWSAVVLKTTGEPAQARPEVADFVERLKREQSFQHHLVAQVWKLGVAPAAPHMGEYLPQWQPELGMGVWPDREAPTGWTEESVSDAMAASLRGEEIALPSHRLLALRTPQNRAAEVAQVMRGSGATIELLSTASLDTVKQHGREQFLPGITHKRFRRARFFLPLLSASTVEAAKNADELEAWLCGARVYVRESAEDRGVLLVFPSSYAAML